MRRRSSTRGTFLRMRKTGWNIGLCMRRRSSTRGTRISACGDVPPHAENRSPHRSPHAETVLRTWNTNLRMRRRTRKTGLRTWNNVSACGDGPPHAEHESPHAEPQVMLKTMRKVPFLASVVIVHTYTLC